jgi:hypothetical protein
MSFGCGFCIETNRHVRGFLVVQQIQQGIGKSKLCIGIFALTGGTWTSYECIISSKNERKSIE